MPSITELMDEGYEFRMEAVRTDDPTGKFPDGGLLLRMIVGKPSEEEGVYDDLYMGSELVFPEPSDDRVRERLHRAFEELLENIAEDYGRTQEEREAELEALLSEG